MRSGRIRRDGWLTSLLSSTCRRSDARHDHVPSLTAVVVHHDRVGLVGMCEFGGLRGIPSMRPTCPGIEARRREVFSLLLQILKRLIRLLCS